MNKKIISFDEALRVFKNKKTIGDLLEVCLLCQIKEDADKVIVAYKEFNPKYAEVNIGYALGYLGTKEREKLYLLFSACNHPVFGSGFGRGKDHTTKEAFEMGKKKGEEIKRKQEEEIQAKINIK